MSNLVVVATFPFGILKCLNEEDFLFVVKSEHMLYECKEEDPQEQINAAVEKHLAMLDAKYCEKHCRCGEEWIAPGTSDQYCANCRC